MAPIKVGIIGYGFSTNCFHLPFIQAVPELQVYAFLQRAAAPDSTTPDDQKPKWGHCTVDFPQAKHYRTADDFFADAEIDLVVVCSHTHEEFVKRALEAGKHVVVEKPFVNTSAAAFELTALAKKKGKILTVFHNRRFDSDCRTLHHLLQQNALGEVREAEIHYDFPSPTWIAGWTKKEYTPGNGMSFGLGTHTIDQALYLFGKPRSVTGFLRSNRGVESEVDDTFTIVLQYDGEKSNLLVTIKTTIVSHVKDQLKFFVRGTKGSYLKFGSCPQEARAIAHPREPAHDPNYGMEDERIWGTLTTVDEFDSKSQQQDPESKLYIGKYPSLPGSYKAYYENVAQAILGKAEIHVAPETARDGLKVIEMARESHEKGCTIPWS